MEPRKNLFVNKYQSNDGEIYFGTNAFFNEADACNMGRDSENWICAVEFVQKEIQHPQPEQRSSELKTMLIADALKLGLKKGDRVWVELEVEAFDNGDCTTAFKHPRRQSVIWLKTRSTQIIYTPQPFVPKHDEICKFEHQSGNIIKCKAIHTEGQICAVSVEKCALGYMFYNADKIKQFLPLE